MVNKHQKGVSMNTKRNEEAVAQELQVVQDAQIVDVNDKAVLEKIIADCSNSSGYVIFAARLTNDTTKEGNFVIVSDYRRYHFSIEDVRESIKLFRDQMHNDLDGNLK